MSGDLQHGSGAAARAVYRVVSYERDEAATGNFKKALLHGVDRQQARHEDAGPARKEKKGGKLSKTKVTASRDDDGE